MDDKDDFGDSRTWKVARLKIIDILKEQFGDCVRLEEKRPHIQQIFAPLYHEDGDMVDIFLDIPSNADLLAGQIIRISDHGMTLMRLSYSFEIDTPEKKKIIQRILSENGLNEEDGELYLETDTESLYPAVMQFAQTVGKICHIEKSAANSIEGIS